MEEEYVELKEKEAWKEAVTEVRVKQETVLSGKPSGASRSGSDWSNTPDTLIRQGKKNKKSCLIL